ncbi:glutamate-5-semialdehyde dehydrogenase [Basidiobolus meristosporus CBS 931.73]|uniref:glutamate-5-semialdehyde dehydrogenase n=1 Tax=Basidiobolus meristosporus CBS 931.73 TaxID=1314790 RepID=A0A1Y1XCR7_9FUNG|nr:glutamate-5-semialdehyde dehydrogenase [Basidiobolus meristosporus CBS 931.73]|eukprot:ORX83515.1 glutamate-5-semialdehyde dehydrogenase [Basidiobolus meristosporus CBS 931.73]
MSSQNLTAVEIAKQAREASKSLQGITAAHKSAALSRIQEYIKNAKEDILKANALDRANAEKEVAAGKLSASLFKRLDIEGPNGSKFDTMLKGVAEVDSLPDPSGQVSLATRLDNGLDLYRVAVPVGVMLVIFEARPEVIVNISALALKSGNAVILKGGKEAIHTMTALYKALRAALESLPAELSIPPSAVQLVSSREEIASLLDQDKYIDIVIPRGSGSLVRYIQDSTRIPVLGHADGLCSVYVDKQADLNKVVDLVVDSKTNYPAACNSAETLLVHEDVVESHLPAIAKGLFAKGVELHADEKSYQVLKQVEGGKVIPAVEEDYDTEFLDLTMAVKVVKSVDEAIDHIYTHGSKHTECIITEDAPTAELFMTKVDAAGAYWNASTRFADGFRYGFGAEIGVSTNKTHARGPVGLEGLMIYKYRLYGNGQTAGSYGVGENDKHYLHEQIPLDSVKNKFVR